MIKSESGIMFLYKYAIANNSNAVLTMRQKQLEGKIATDFK